MFNRCLRIALVLLSTLMFFSCATYKDLRNGTGDIIEYNTCSINLPMNWSSKTLKRNRVDDIVWIFKSENKEPWIDICIVKDKPDRDLNEEVVFSGRNGLLRYLHSGPKKDYSVGGSGSEVNLWNREGSLAKFEVTNNEDINDSFEYYYFGSRIKNINKVLFITVIMRPEDSEEVNSILLSLKINNEL